MVFNETTNHNFILLSKQGHTQLIYSTEHVFENFGRELPGCSPPDCGISEQDLSVSLRTVVLKHS